MTDIDKVLAIVKENYSSWELNPQRFENGYQYESTFVAMMELVEKEVFAVSVGRVPVDRNKKKNLLPDLEK